jgi:hypothetical protein
VRLALVLITREAAVVGGVVADLIGVVVVEVTAGAGIKCIFSTIV